MTSVFTVLALGAGSALVYAAAAVAQRAAAARDDGRGLGRSLAWWVSVPLNGLGALLHTAGLRYGSLVAVQMLGVLTLVAAPLLSALLLGRRMSPAQWSGTATTVAGVVGLLMLVPSSGADRPLGGRELVAVVALTAVCLGVPMVVAAVTRRTVVVSLAYAAAAGVAFGAASAFAQTAVLGLTGRGPLTPGSALLVAVGVAALAPGGLMLCQLAYRSGLEAPLATVTLVNPVFAAVIGVVVLGDRYATGAATVLAGLAAALTAARGVLVLARAEQAPAAPRGYSWDRRSKWTSMAGASHSISSSKSSEASGSTART
ncbi:DMT family protein [Streptomyces sp. 7R007]